MWNKIKWNIEYILCILCGVLTLAFLALPYIEEYDIYYGWKDVYTYSGFETASVLICLVVPFLLIFGLLGLLKKNGEFPSRKLAFVFLMIYGIFNIIIFLLALIGFSVGNELEWHFQIGAYLLLGLSFFEFVVLFIMQKKCGLLNTFFACSKCGKKSKYGNKFCVKCGGAIVIQNGFACTNCGKRARKSDKFCAACGGKVDKKIIQQVVRINSEETETVEKSSAKTEEETAGYKTEV